MKFITRSTIGLNTDQEAALIVSESNDSGQIFITMLKVVCDDAFTTGRQILSEVEDLYQESEETGAKKLDGAFTQAIQKLSEVERFDLTLASVSGKVLYLVNRGTNSVFLKRQNKLSNLVAVAPHSQVISGFVQEGDRLFFATENLVNFLGEELGQNLKLPLEVWEEETSNKITSTTQDSAGLAALVLDVMVDLKQQIEDNLTGINPQIPTLNDLPPEAKVKLGNLKIRAQEIISQLLSLLSKVVPRTKKVRFVIGIILLIVIISGVGLAYKRNLDRQNQQSFEKLLQQAKDDFALAQSLSKLNPNETKSKLDSASLSLDEALKLKPGMTEAQELKKQISEQSESILQQFNASQASLFLELDLIKKGLKSSQMSLIGTNLVILDSETKTLVTIDIAKKSNKILAGEADLGQAKYFSVNGSFVYVYSENKGIVRVELASQKATTVSKKDPDLSDTADIAGFGSNVYVLDPDASQIWKYVPTGSGYAEKAKYLGASVKADLKGAKRMQIESSVYVFKEGGEILRFTKGVQDNFALSGLDKGIKNPNSFFTSSDVDNVYILDTGNSRLVVVDKTGNFKAQYQGDKFAVASDVVVDETGKKAYLLEGGKIFTVDLK